MCAEVFLFAVDIVFFFVFFLQGEFFGITSYFWKCSSKHFSSFSNI